MSIFDKLKKEEKGEKKVEKKKEKKEEIKEEKKSGRKRAGKYLDSFKVLKEPHITEKATDLTGNNQYVFKVFPRANKVETKKAIEELYNVDVLKVRIINVPPKPKRLGKTEGERSSYKKAIVRIKEGQKIELLPR
jgi:large subunit ribosomal protein L23